MADTTSQAEAQAPTTAALTDVDALARECFKEFAVFQGAPFTFDDMAEAYKSVWRFNAQNIIDRLTPTVGAPAPVTPEICNSQDCGSTGKMDDCPWAKPSAGQFCDHYASYYKKLVGAPAPAPTMPTPGYPCAKCNRPVNHTLWGTCVECQRIAKGDTP